MVRCSVINCKNDTKMKIEGLSFHTFPTEPEIRNMWIIATGRLYWTPRTSSRICNQHFDQNHIIKKKSKTYLQHGSVPKYKFTELANLECSMLSTNREVTCTEPLPRSSKTIIAPLEHDMQNYVQFKIMGSTKRIILIPRCVPSRFDCRNEHESVSNESCLAEAKRLRISVCKDLVPDHIETDDVKALCIEESPAVPNVPLKNKSDKVVEVPEHMATPPVIGQKHMATPVVTSQKHMATPVVISQEHMATPVVISRISRKHEGIQDYPKAQYIIKPMKSDVKNKVEMTTPMKFIASTSTSPLKTSMINATKPSVSRLCFIEEKCDNDTLCTQSFVKSTVDQDYCLSKAEDIIARVYNYLQAEYEQLKSSIGGHCDLSPLANILARTAAATGVSELAVSAILEQRKRSAVEEQPLDNGPAKRANFTCEGGENVSPITDDESTWNASYEEQDDENEQMDDDSEEQDEFKLRMEIKIEDEDEMDSAVGHVISSTSNSCPTSDTFVEKPVKIKIEPNTVDTELKPKAVRTILPHVQLRGSACEVTRVACDNVYTPLEIIPYRGLLFLAQNWTI